jgi:NAD(P)-dependent dehydrogenase (short-subunit alcohol dehydrogenase family)
MLFGIDVVMIEPGTVNTSMYDKGEKEDKALGIPQHR